MHPSDYLLLLLAGLLALSPGQPHPECDADGRTNSSCQQAPGVREGSPSLKIAPGNTDFALRLYHLMASEAPRENIVFSPLSISAALAMLSLAADSHLQAQILQDLGFNLTEMSESDVHRGFQHLLQTLRLPGSGLETHVGSALFLSQDLPPLPKLLNDTMAFYGSKLFHTSFRSSVGAVQLINEHVQRETRGKIVNLVSSLSADTESVLVNYIYFKALWKKPFKRSRTTPEDFHVDEHTVVRVPMMLQDQAHHWYLHDRYLPCSVLRLDYTGDAMALLILPNRGKMQQIEQVLTPEMLMRWTSLLQKGYFYRKLELHFPKFAISGSYELDLILPKLGFTDLFSHRANFSSTSPGLKLQASKSFHKATLNMDEVGTEAVAATGVSTVFTSAWHTHRVLWFNRPFLVVIFSTSTKSVLFLGKVVNPTKP
ncbi:kallistatin [Tupaia chinensis]|uniref:Kallistatin n=1 Tax=Tupaia chinensis TaxID=246437 RepID=L8Y7B3_TUPCH|nr:kallistatin [Tupaia chinensis]XP_027622884.1 kallistatin [Tupaia chinensis]XP_027622886.1 kallistatin [Tupaia chinensis]ELV12132.1 Kallistatin [Tupaia chinensis]